MIFCFERMTNWRDLFTLRNVTVNWKIGQFGLTFGIEKPRNAVLALGDVKYLMESFTRLIRPRCSPIYEIRAVPVQKSTEG